MSKILVVIAAILVTNFCESYEIECSFKKYKLFFVIKLIQKMLFSE